MIIKDTIFDQYTIQSAANNVINLEVPLSSLQRALRSALQATSASIRLTKKNDVPLLALTIVTNTMMGNGGDMPPSASAGFTDPDASISTGNSFGTDINIDMSGGIRERETIVTQDIPVRVLSPAQVEGIHQPVCREPDVHILLPSLMQLKSLSDRFTRLSLAAKATTNNPAIATTNVSNGSRVNGTGNAATSRLEMAANMHGCLRLSLRADAMNISSVWTGLSNPELDPSQVEGGDEGIRQHPSTRMKELGSADGVGEEGWATVRIDGKDWSKVMSVGRLGGRVIACKLRAPVS